MPVALDLTLPPPLLGGPFTTSAAAAVGVPRHRLDAMLRTGAARRVLRGVYVAADAPDDTGVRAAALTLAVGPGGVAVDRTAAWLHGLDLPGEPVHARDVLGRSRPGSYFGARRHLAEREVQVLPPGVRVTTPERTVLDLGRLLAPARALATADLGLRAGGCTEAGLRAALPAQALLRGADRLPNLVDRADARAADPVESFLRQAWYDANLPDPVPALRVAGARLVLGLPTHRFGAVLDAPAPAATAAGWTVVAVPAWRVRHGDPQLVADRLRAAFGAHLLGVPDRHDA